MIDDIDGIARALHGRRQGDGSWLCRCPVPTHGKGKGDRNPSLSICQGKERLLINCFANCHPLDILDELRRRGWIDSPERVVEMVRRRTKPPPPPHRHDPDPEAVAIWHTAVPIAGTLAADYLAGRGLAIDVAPSLRFLPSYPVGGRSYPAMVAAVQSADRRIVAVQLTFIDTATAKKATLAMPRKTVGALGDGAVRLGPAGPVLGLAEGTESALGAMHLAGVPTWASLGGKRMHRVEVPPEVKTIHIFCDDDAPGHTAARRTAAHHKALGREVAIRLPAAGISDWAEWAATPTARVAA